MKRLLALFLSSAVPAAAMTPPSLSVNVMPRSAASGLSALSDERRGAGVTAWRSVRRRLLEGSTTVDNVLHERTESFRTTLWADAPLGPRWTAAAAFPMVRTRSSYDGGGDEAAGPGDATLLVKYALLRNAEGPARRELQLVAGLKLATGETHAKDGAGRDLPAPQQPGSGSTDLIAGAAAAVNLRRLSLYGDATCRRAGTRAYTFGDAFAANLGANLPFGPRKRWSATAEANLEIMGRDDSSRPGPGVLPDGTVRDSGHEVVSLTPGFQWRPSRRWTLSAAVQLPVRQKYRGRQLAAEANTILSVQGRWGRHGG